MSQALRLRLKLKELSESLALGRFTSKEKSLAGFEPEEVRRLEPGDSPSSSSFDALKSILYKRYFLRVKRAEKSVRALICLDTSPSMRVGFGQITKREFMLAVAGEVVEGFTEAAAEVGFIAWSSEIEDELPPLSGVFRARERLTMLSEKNAKRCLTRPAALFNHLLKVKDRPSIVFVFSDWHDTGEFGEALKKCLAAKLDIVPIVISDTFSRGTPRFLGDMIFKSAESKTAKVLERISPEEAEGVKIFSLMKLPFIAISPDAEDGEWRDNFIEFFENRIRERG